MPAPATPTRRARWPLYLVAALLLVAVVVFALHGRSAKPNWAHLDWRDLAQQLRAVSLLHVLLGIASIAGGMGLRAWRWRLLMGRDARRFSLAALLGPQIVGFGAVALFGRLADLTRPILTARRTGTRVAAQVAVYSLERMLDLGAAAVLFSVTLALAPRSTPHHEALVRAGALSLAATLLIAAFAMALRFAAQPLIAALRRVLTPLSPGLAAGVADKAADFASGMRAVGSAGDFILAVAISLVMWLGIAWAYVEAMHSFTATPALAHVSFTQAMLLFATSLGGSLLQLPGLGWFTQIAVLAAAMHVLYGAELGTATACAVVMLFVVTLWLIPAGLVAAQLTGTSLRSAKDASAAAEEAVLDSQLG